MRWIAPKNTRSRMFASTITKNVCLEKGMRLTMKYFYHKKMPQFCWECYMSESSSQLYNSFKDCMQTLGSGFLLVSLLGLILMLLL